MPTVTAVATAGANASGASVELATLGSRGGAGRTQLLLVHTPPSLRQLRFVRGVGVDTFSDSTFTQ
eukprot:CAMPEP_0181212348 /NCGR_PEP_ID=MMETSP1096-20121128/24301_1 /TAXON_ID=156174 ORGANISM="Chrysochromulina ericina, Strain CCMP281" /NCGR_SAMPLE_ID=MMETSP1096 /ASSEMBLY_ACC=CAM_ASM_000453 /LENGTH=65 /DNA_ID=CAMNT_0023303869 /DNA_START=231 /DNA_END=428 /DNA_ORIENTATION=-